MRGNELGNYIKLLRIKNNMTMTQTAGITGITQGYISQIENGIYTPSAKTLAKLARAYNVPEIHLLRKAGIVQSIAPGMPEHDSASGLSSFEADPLVEVSDGNELMDMLRRGITNLEYLSSQIRQRGQISSLPAASYARGQDQELSSEMTLPVYESNWQPVTNVAGEHAGFHLPASLCNDDIDAFVLSVDDNAMAPIVTAGDWVVVSPASKPVNGCMVAINDRNQIKLRSYMEVEGMLALSPANSDYAHSTLLIERSGEKVEIVGRALRVVNREL
ncbi:LexA family transcriptional regulator [bacterium]|nr:LexA family transcriptional regulator [bacterium]